MAELESLISHLKERYKKEVREEKGKITILNRVDRVEDNFSNEVIVEEGNQTYFMICSIFPDNNQAFFYGSYATIAPLIGELKPLVRFLKESRYKTNLFESHQHQIVNKKEDYQNSQYRTNSSIPLNR